MRTEIPLKYLLEFQLWNSSYLRNGASLWPLSNRTRTFFKHRKSVRVLVKFRCGLESEHLLKERIIFTEKIRKFELDRMYLNCLCAFYWAEVCTGFFFLYSTFEWYNVRMLSNHVQSSSCLDHLYFEARGWLSWWVLILRLFNFIFTRPLIYTLTER